MDTDELEHGPAAISSDMTEFEVSPPPPEAPRPSIRRFSWQGAKAGVRWACYIAGPIAVVMLIVGIGLIAFGVGAGGGWGVDWVVPGAFRFFFGAVLGGAYIGGLIGLIVTLSGRSRLVRRLAPWWAAAGRPIRVPWRRRREAMSAGADMLTDAASPRRPGRFWPWLVGVPAMLTLLALTVGTTVGMYLGRTVNRRLAEAINAADRDDPYWRIDDLMAHRKLVPDDENSALVAAKVMSRLPENWPGTPTPPPGRPKPPPTDAMKAYDRLMATAENVRLDDATADTLRDELAEYREVVEIGRTLADYRRGRHELVLGPTLIDTDLAETQGARALARLLAADAAIRGHDGDIEGAVESCRAILGAGRSIGDEPFLISQLVRVAIGGAAMKSIRRVLGQGEPSDRALARLQALVLDEMSQPLLLYAMRGERATLTELIRRVGAGEVPVSALGDGAPPFVPGGRRVATAPWGNLMAKNQHAILLEWMNAAVAMARRPAAERLPFAKACDAEVERVAGSRFGYLTSTLPLFLSPAVSSAAEAHSRDESELGATAVLLAAERHRRKTGDWPASIDAIDRGILASAPIDPYSGRALLMEHRDGRLFVHSIGPNHKDEHGAYEPKRWGQRVADDVGAWAWDVPLRRQPPDPE